MPEYTSFKGVDNISDTLLNESLETNLIHWLDWCFLGIGGFGNVRLNSSGVYSGSLATLREVSEPNYSARQVYEGFRPNWVYETNIDYDTQPIAISGVYVDNVFHPANSSGSFAHTVNYPLGRVIFNSPIPSGSVVKLEYSYRKVSVISNTSRFAKTLMFDSYRPDANGFTVGSGVFTVLGQGRLALPAVVVHVVDDRENIPMQLGGGVFAVQNTLFYIFTEDPGSLKTLKDIFSYQQEKTFYLYDRDAAIASGVMPLNNRGAANPSGWNYPQLVEHPDDGGFRDKRAYFKRVNIQSEQSNPRFYTAIARAQISVDLP